MNQGILLARATTQHGEKLTWLARWGYGARGAVYLIVGFLALMAALGTGGQTTDTRGALQQLLAQPAGTFLLALVAVGLMGYSLWRTVQAFADPDHHGTSAKGVAIRAGLLVSALVHVGLAVFALSLIFGWGTGGGSTQNWTAKLMSMPFGKGLVAAVGIAIIAAGLAHIVKGWKADFEKYLYLDADNRRWMTPVSRIGLIARGVTFLIIGGFFIVAAWQTDPSEARGLDGALQTLQAQPYGTWLLAIIAAGLVAFGVYSFVEAKYRRINIP